MAATAGAEAMASKDLSEWEAARGIQVGVNATYGPWSIRTMRGPIGDKAAMEQYVRKCDGHRGTRHVVVRFAEQLRE